MFNDINDELVTIDISGGICSGKTTIAAELNNFLHSKNIKSNVFSNLIPSKTIDAICQSQKLKVKIIDNEIRYRDVLS